MEDKFQVGRTCPNAYLKVYTMAPWDIRGGAFSPMSRSAERLVLRAVYTHQWVWQTELMSTVVGPLTLYLACKLSHALMSDSVAPWTVACKAPLSVGFTRHGYWSGLPFPTPGALPNSGIKPASPALTGGFFHHWATWESHFVSSLC